MVETIKKRNIALFIFLGFITCGIYWIVVFCKISKDINRICEGDGRDTMFLFVDLVVRHCNAGYLSLGVVL